MFSLSNNDDSMNLSHAPCMHAPCENSFHFFFECTLYDDFRETLLTAIDNLGGQKILHSILFGDPNLDVFLNTKIFLSVHKFIETTNRFSS